MNAPWKRSVLKKSICFVCQNDRRCNYFQSFRCNMTQDTPFVISYFAKVDSVSFVVKFNRYFERIGFFSVPVHWVQHGHYHLCSIITQVVSSRFASNVQIHSFQVTTFNGDRIPKIIKDVNWVMNFGHRDPVNIIRISYIGSSYDRDKTASRKRRVIYSISIYTLFKMQCAVLTAKNTLF